MNETHLSAVIWRLRRGSRALGVPGVLGLAVLAFGLAFYLSTVQPTKTRLTDLKRETERLRGGTQAAAPIERILAPDEQLSAFYAFFPGAESAPDWLGKLFDAAGAQGVSIERGEYRLVRDGAGRLLRYEVVLPVKSGYLQVRKFLAQALADIPNAALEGVTFQRRKVAETSAETQIRLTIFLGER